MKTIVQDWQAEGLDHAEIYRRVANATSPKSREAFFAFRGRQACIQKAMQVPLPGAAADAFLNGVLEAAEKKIYEIYPVTLAALQAVDSPLLKMAEAATEAKSKQSNQDWTLKDQWNVCWIFTAHPEQLMDLMDKSELKNIPSSAEKSFRAMNAASISAIVRASILQMARHIRTFVKFAAETEASGDKSFFQEIRELKPKE